VKIFIGIVGMLFAVIVLGVTLAILLTPWMDRWGTTNAEAAATYPSDMLLPHPAGFGDRAVTINAKPEQIYPWIVQLGAGKGGMYSYSWLETYLLNCRLVNAERIHPEWQDLKVGDLVRMCPGESGPVPHVVAQIEPNRAIVLGHQENGRWVDLWQFVLNPQSEKMTRLILRTRTMAVSGTWDMIHPGIFIMERGMLLGIKGRAESAIQ